MGRGGRDLSGRAAHASAGIAAGVAPALSDVTNPVRADGRVVSAIRNDVRGLTSDLPGILFGWGTSPGRRAAVETDGASIGLVSGRCSIRADDGRGAFG